MLNKIVVFIIYVYCGGSLAVNSSRVSFHRRSDYTYDGLVEGWLKLHRVPATWHEARLRCYFEGAVLASPLNENMKKVFLNFLSEPMFLYSHYVFTGIHSTFSKRDYTSIEGTPLHEMPVEWTSHSTFGDCVVLTNQEKIIGDDCASKHAYICYKKGPEDLLQQSKCGTFDEEYKYYPETQSCYKFHRIGRTWSRAHMTCLAEGGHLAIINSPLEADVIRRVFSVPDKSIMATYTHTASIGFLDWGERGSWWTVHGQSLAEAGYDIWNKGSPDSKDQFCGAVVRDGTLNDVWCDKDTFPAICEIDAAAPEQE